MEAYDDEMPYPMVDEDYVPESKDSWLEDFDPDDEIEYYEEENLARTARWFIKKYGYKPQSWDEVELQLEEGFNAKDPEAVFYYADYHFYHLEYKTAIRYFLSAAESGVTEAQKVLGEMFYTMARDEDDKDILEFHDIVEKHGWIEDEYPERIL